MKQFEVVQTIVACGSISKAAKKLKIAQPTLSKYLANVEKELGTELFDRKTVPVKLTEAGERFLRAGKQILDEYSRLRRDIARLSDSSPDVIRVGMSPTRAHYILPSLMSEFRRLNPYAKVIIRERTTTQLNAELSRGELDLIISLKYEGTKQFESVSLFYEDVVLAVPKKYKAFDGERILRECLFISVGAGLRMSNVLRDILTDFGANEPVLEAQSIESVVSLVNEGMGAALVPSYVSKYGGYKNIKFVELPDTVKKRFGRELGREVCVFYREETMLSPSEKDFIEACRKL